MHTLDYIYQLLHHLLFFIWGPINKDDGTVVLAEVLGLEQLAENLHVSVITGVLPAGWWGAFHAPTRTVTMLAGLPAEAYRSVLAHELGHAYLNHSGGYAHHDSIHERAADRFAAKMLIRFEDARAALRECGPETDAIAKYLNVMPWVVREYSRTPDGMLLLSMYASAAGEQNVPTCVWDKVHDQTLTAVVGVP